MRDHSWIARWFVPDRRRDHSCEVASEKARLRELDREMQVKAHELRVVLAEITERKRGQNDA